MNFYTTEMQNLSSRSDEVSNIRIIVSDSLSGKYHGDARMTSFNDIWLELPEKIGRYKLKTKAIKELHKHFIEDLDDLYHKAWLVDNGDWVLRNLQKV